jgi:glycosyltransferase involved in cell wall biosynthesis
MNLEQITPLILTYNEEPNLGRTLDRLAWAAQILVLDSFSTDATVDIARSYPNVTVVQRAFDDHATQWSHGVSLITQPWVLALDADYVLGEGFENELRSLKHESIIDAYTASFRYLIYGEPLGSSLYPPRVVLFRQSRCHFERDGHTQRLRAKGEIAPLRSWINHDDRKPLTRWVISQDKYALLEAEKISSASFRALPFQDRIRRTMILGPITIFFYTLLVRGTLFDGWAGWFYTFQRTLAEIMLSLRLLEKRINGSPAPSRS